MTARTKSALSALARIRSSAAIKRNQSSLYQWYVRHYDEFAAIVAGVSRPGWDVIASELMTENLSGLVNAKDPAAYARQTWWKVRKAHGRRKVVVVPNPPVVTQVLTTKPGEIAPGVRPAAEQPETEFVQPRPRFAPATLRGHTPTPSAPPFPASVPLQPARQDASQVIANLLGRNLNPKDAK